MPGPTESLTIEAVATRQEVLPATTACEAVHEIFHADPLRTSILMDRADDDGIHLVNRRTFLQAMTGRLGSGRPVAEVLPDRSHAVPSTTDLEEAALAAVTSARLLPGDDMLVSFAPGWGTVPVARLYQHIAELHASRAEEMRRSEHRFRSMIESSQDVIIVLDRDGLVKYQSRHLDGVPTTTLGSHAFAHLHEDDAAELAVSLHRMMRDKVTTAEGEFRLPATDGAWRCFEYNARSLLEDPAVEGIVVNVREITVRRELEDRLRHDAVHDPLTGLPNKELLLQRATSSLRRLERTAGVVSLFYCDLDGFKAINDGLGHAGGDEVLAQAARRIADVVRRGDTIARFGGDEFVVIAEDCSRPMAADLADRLVRALAEPMMIDGVSVDVTLSVGYASTRDRMEAVQLLKQADAAMYTAKAEGRNRSAEFDSRTQERELRERHLVADLRSAIVRDELVVVYQPIFATKSREIIGAEALLRWNHPVLGAVSPVEFIPLAERHNMIPRIGEWVLAQTCRDLGAWVALGTAPRWVSVNVSASQLDDFDLVRRVSALLDAHGLRAEQLHIELTESGVAEGVGSRLETLAALRALGLEIALDDFGTGYSSLSSVSHVPLDVIKIDRSFVSDLGRRPESALMLRGIVELAHTLGYEVVAEGVEEESEMSHLEEMGCDYIQGFLLGRPGPPGAIADLARAALSDSL